MKKFSTIAALSLAAMITLASCGREKIETTPTATGENSVKIGMVYNRAGESRAPGSAIADQTALDFTEGHIFFATTGGQINKHVGVGNAAGSENVTKAKLIAGNVVIEGIPSGATQCYIVFTDVNSQLGSATGITGNKEGTNISTILASSVNVGNINDPAGAVANVPLYGTDVVTPTAGTTPDTTPYTATVTVTINSLASRLQIGQISAAATPFTYTDGVGDNHSVTIDEFKVEGIYVNNFHPSYTIASNGAAVVDHGSTPANYSTTAANAPYNSATAVNYAKLADYLNTTATGSPLAVAAADVWAYNVFPGTVSHVIVKLTGVKYTDTNTTQSTSNTQTLAEQYLTVNSFKYGAAHANAGDPVASFVANNIYTLDDIAFDYGDMDNVPYESTLDVNVNVTIMKWLDNAIEWNN